MTAPLQHLEQCLARSMCSQNTGSLHAVWLLGYRHRRRDLEGQRDLAQGHMAFNWGSLDPSCHGCARALGLPGITDHVSLHWERPRLVLASFFSTSSLGARTFLTPPSVPSPGLGPRQPQIDPRKFLDGPQPVLSLPRLAVVLPFRPLPDIPHQGTLSFRGRRGRFSRLGLRGLGSGSCRAR